MRFEFGKTWLSDNIDNRHVRQSVTSQRALRNFDQIVSLLKRQSTSTNQRAEETGKGPGQNRVRGGSAVSHCDAVPNEAKVQPLQPEVNQGQGADGCVNGDRIYRPKIRLTPRTSRDDLDDRSKVASPAHHFTSLQHSNGDDVTTPEVSSSDFPLDDVTQQKWLALRVRGGTWRWPSMGRCFNSN